MTVRPGGVANIVSDEDYRGSVRDQTLEEIEDGAAVLRVEISRRLIGEDQISSQYESARDRDTLLFAGG